MKSIKLMFLMIVSFELVYAYEALHIISPIDTAVRLNGKITFQWQPVTNTAIYSIVAYPLNKQNEVIWETILDEDFTPTETSCVNGGICSVSRLVPVDAAVWKIRTVSTEGVVSEYTPYQAFHIESSEPGGAYPVYFPKASKNWRTEAVTPMSAPAYLGSLIDKDTNLLVTRLGGNPDEMGVSDFTLPHTNGGSNEALSERHGQHFYSRTNPANVNETFALGGAGGSNGGAALWDLSSKKLVSWVPTGETFGCGSCVYQRQLLWDKVLPNVYWYVSENKLMRAEINFNTFDVNIETKEFNGFDIITFGEGEGDFSDDGKKIVLVGSKTGSKNQSFVAYALGDNWKQGSVNILPMGTELDWAGVDPTGQFIVFNEGDVATYVLPFDLKGEKRLLYNNTKHSDFVLDSSGEPWIVYGNYQGVFASKISAPLLKQVWPVQATLSVDADHGENPDYDGKQEESTASGHISRVSGLSGTVLISRNIDGGLYYLNIDNPETIVYAGNTRHGKRTTGDIDDRDADLRYGVDYYGEIIGTKAREPRGSASSTGKYIFFVSDYFVYSSSYNLDSNSSYEPTMQAFLNMIELNTGSTSALEPEMNPQTLGGVLTIISTFLLSEN